MRALRELTAVGLLTAVAVGVTGVPGYAATAGAGEPVALVVGLRAGADAAAPADRLAEVGDVDVLTHAVVPGTGAVTVDVPDTDVADALAALRGDPDISYVELDRTARAAAVTADDPLREYQWGIDNAGVAAAWQRTTGSADVTVAVLDTGVNPVSELAGAILPGIDLVNGDNVPTDDEGHGTMTATVLAGRGDNGAGIAGICWTCKILPVKVLDHEGSGSYSDIAAGIVWAADHGADIINLSLGGEDASELLTDAVAHAVDAGALVIAAAGNEGNTVAQYPGAIPAVLAVGASTDADTRYSWSTYGANWVDIAGPGCNPAQDVDGDFYFFCGTSSATPFVAGVAALALAAGPAATAAQLRTALTSTAAPLGGGWVAKGRVDAGRAVRAVPGAAAGAPVVAVTTPTAGAYLRTSTVTVTPAVTDDVAVTGVELLVDGVPVDSAAGAPWTMQFDSTDHSGWSTLTVVAVDGDGQVGTADVRVVLDTSAPTASIRSPGAGATLRGTVTVGVNATDDVGVYTVELLVGGRVVATDTRHPWVVAWKSGRTNRPVGFAVRVRDRAGNATTLTRTVTVDNTAPTVGLKTRRHKSRGVRGTVKVKAAIRDANGVSRAEVLVNGKVVARDRTAPYVLRVKTGRYGRKLAVQVRAYDRAGNVRHTPRRTWYR